MANRRIVLVIRKDLELPVGLAMAQAAHLGDEWLRNRICNARHPVDDMRVDLQTLFTPDEFEWMQSPTLSVLTVNTPEELAKIEAQAKMAKLPCHSWVDTVHSAVLDCYLPKVKIGIAIGPVEDDMVKPVTGKLPLY